MIAPTRQTRFDEDGDCLRAALATVTGKPLDEVVNVLDGAEPEHKWFARVQEWLASLGFAAIATEDAPEGYGIAVGATVRGEQSHAVVCKGGDLVFDPHPSNAFLTEVHHYIALERA